MEYGFINVHKPSGVSSAFVVSRVRHLTGLSCGHLGTLDPLASGVLPVALGRATRLFNYMLEKKKRYEAVFRFGVRSDTLDSTGEVEVTGGKVPTEEELCRAIPALSGEVDQMPPKYSAKRIGGRHGYELARKGEEFELSPKRVTIDRIELLGKVAPDSYSFRIDCGAGTYIRSIARDLAAACGTDGIMTALVRSQSGAFSIEDAVPLEELTKENVEEYLVPTDDALDLPKIEIENEHIFFGLPQATDEADGLYKIYRGGELYGLVEVKNKTAKSGAKLC